MGVVLVAALVVPLAVIPGTFGFDSWPASRGERVTERQVRLPAPKLDVVAVRPPAVGRRPVVAAVRPAPARRARVTTVALAVTPRREPVVHVSTPAPKPDRHPTPPRPEPQPAPAPAPAQPQAPRSQPQQPTKTESGLLANGNTPVAREVPQDPAPAQPGPQSAPAPTPPPVTAPAPVERAVPSEPCHGHDHGHADGREGGPHGDAGFRD
jgi:hypothetical protein